MHREHFYVRPEDVFENELAFRNEECRHLIHVLRKKIGDVVCAVDGEGNIYEVRLVKKCKNDVAAVILKTYKNAREPNVEITLAQGMIKHNRFDWLVEKATELGVKRIVPVCSKQSAIRTLTNNRILRLQKIALSAMKQSGRSVLPEIMPVQTLDQLLKGSSDFDDRFVAHPVSEKISLPIAVLSDKDRPRRILCLVGPEGGFEDFEVESAIASGFHPVSLGSRRLRAETAGVALLVLMLSKFGE